MRVAASPQMRQLMAEILAVRYTDTQRELACAQALLQQAQAADHGYCTAFAYTYLGDYYISQNNNEQSTLYLRQAQKLCQNHHFSDLLPRVYNLLGICHEAFDEQTSIRYYLDALDLPGTAADLTLKCSLYNNIASEFELHRDYETALAYYLQAAELAATLPDASSYLLLRLWSNLSQLSLTMGRAEDGLRHIRSMQQLQAEEKDFQALLIHRGLCQYYAATGQHEEAARCAHCVLDTASSACSDQYLVFELMHSICESMITTGNAELAQLVLWRLRETNTEQELHRKLQLQVLAVRICEAFGSPEETAKAYGDYYRTNQMTEALTHQLRAGGMKSILKLHEAQKAHAVARQELLAMENQVYFDELTRLYNRRYFNKVLEQSTGAMRLGLVMVDVDYFKQYNDTLGHASGDAVLRTVARSLQVPAVPSVLACRYGGDEFACICQDMEDDEIEGYISQVMQEMAHLAIPHPASPVSDFLTLSFGYSNGRHSPKLLFSQADEALYAAKQAGRNTFSRADKL